ncbi:MAG: redoxin domain-containing protein [Bacteroidales bacterium]|nr:redoxin domain-containing protein [Bacteroidales bacterium]
MRNTFIILAILIISIGCNNKPKHFDFTIKGKVIGQDSGEIFYSISPRAGDDIIIPFENGEFEHKGKANEILFSYLAFYDDAKTGACSILPIFIEPGVIEVELYRDSISEKSKVLQGSNSLNLQEVIKTTSRYFNRIYSRDYSDTERDSLFRNVYSDSVALLIEKNADNFNGIRLIYSFSNSPLLNMDQLSRIFKKITKPDLRHSFYFRKRYSNYLARKNEYNKIGSKAINFHLQDSTGKVFYFNDIAKNKTVFVEKSGSWCGNQTNESHKLDTIYAQYKDKGFEIITVVSEAKPDRWKNWLKTEMFPWPNLVEIDFDDANDVIYSEQIFLEGDYLIDESGVVIANDLTPEKLNEILMEKYEPQKYTEYVVKKWELPEGVYLLDREKPIKTFEGLTLKFAGKAFFIDCYATWCSPCIEEFQYKEELKEFLNKHNIELVYISFNRKLGDAKWLNFIKEHNLTGYHMRANENFVSDFKQKAEFNTLLPTYLIIDKTGKLVEQNAFRPSDKQKLFNQLKTKLNL